MTVTKEPLKQLSPLKRLTFFQKLHAFDRDLAMIFSVSSDGNSSMANLRPLLKLLEISGHGVPWLIGVVLVMFYTNGTDPQIFEVAFNILFALLLDLAISGSIKALVRRERPATNGHSDMFFVVSVDQYSFPSGHTTRAAMLAVLAVLMFPLSTIAEYLITVWMLCIAASRLMLGRHHPSDVIAGIVIGYFQALLVQHFWFRVANCEEVLQLLGLEDNQPALEA